MSTRAQAKLYGSRGRRGFPSPTPQSAGSNPPLIPALFGKDKMTGGLTIDPKTGKVVYTPYQGSSGFLGNWSRGQAGEMNNIIMMQKFAEQEALARREAEIKAEAEKQKQLEIERGRQERKGKRTEGKQQRKTITHGSDVKNIGSTGALITEENRNLYAKGDKPKIEANITEAELRSGFMREDPRAQETIARSIMGPAESNYWTNFKNAAVPVPQGGAVAFGMDTGINAPELLMGPNAIRDVRTTINPLTGMPESQQVEKQTPPYFIQQPNPDIIQGIRDLPSPTPSAPEPGTAADLFMNRNTNFGIPSGQQPDNVDMNLLGQPNNVPIPPVVAPPDATNNPSPIPSSFKKQGQDNMTNIFGNLGAGTLSLPVLLNLLLTNKIGQNPKIF